MSSTPLAEVIPIDLPSRPSIGRTVTRTQSIVSSTFDTIADVASSGVRAATRRLTEEPSDATDDWGRDAVLVRNMMFAAQLRWDVSTGGDQRLPKRKGALIVVNSPRWTLAPIFAAFAISEAVDRPVRYVGRRDDDLVGAMSRRLGGLLDHPDEIAGALRADELVVLGAETTGSARSVGIIDHTIVGAAIATDCRVFPAATTSHLFGRHARVEIGSASRVPRTRRGPLAELELADRLRDDVGELLTAMGDISTGSPLDWLPLGGLAGA